MRRHWLSFVDTKVDVGMGFAIVTADSFLEAVMLSHLNGWNPGGEVLGMPFDDSDPRVPSLPADGFWTVADAVAAGLVELEDLGPNTRAAFEMGVSL